MNEDPLPHLQDLLLRRDLSPEESRQLEDWLRRHPEFQPAWQEESRLSEAIRRLPDAVVPSNFTRRVLDEVRQDAARASRDRERSGSRRRWQFPVRWIPAAAAAAIVILFVGSGLWDWRIDRQQAEFRRDVTELRAIAAVPQEVLEDFDAIRRFGENAPPVDFELLAALE